MSEISRLLTAVVIRLYEDFHLVLLVEAVLVLAAILWAIRWPRAGERRFQAIENQLRRSWDRPGMQLLIAGMFAFLARGIVLPLVGPPVPQVHDEYSLVLQAQTFVSGRMTNPTHPHWEHFENVHINQQPTYSSIYFPGRGFLLALGIWIGGHPWVGVWLSSVLMAVAVCWMLQAWLPSPFALAGAVLAVTRYGIFSYWINSYWGGLFPAAGGALILGALPRILKRQRLRDGLLLGCGVLILVTTRPYEGVLLSLPVALAFAAWVWNKSRPTLAGAVRSFAPALVFGAAGIAIICYYSWRVTGDPFRTPYDVNRETYAKAPAFLISPPLPEPSYRHSHMKRFYDWEVVMYHRRNSLSGLGTALVSKLRQLWMFFIGPAFTIPFLFSLGLLRDRKVLFLTATALFFVAGYLIETWGFAHYASPATALLLALVMFGFQRLRKWEWRGRPSGLLLSRTLPAICFVVLLLPVSTSLWEWPDSSGLLGKHLCCAFSDGSQRYSADQRLRRLPGRDLVFVHYGEKYTVHDEWVFNEPDIDNSEVVWARDLGEERNARLIGHLKGRHVWQLKLNQLPGGSEARISRYH